CKPATRADAWPKGTSRARGVEPSKRMTSPPADANARASSSRAGSSRMSIAVAMRWPPFTVIVPGADTFASEQDHYQAASFEELEPAHGRLRPDATPEEMVPVY